MSSPCTFILPDSSELPDDDVAAGRLIAFANRYDPTPWLERLWCEGFHDKACRTWQDHWSRFKAGQPAPTSALMILFTLNYDIVSGAHLYRRERVGESFHHWLLEALRPMTRQPAAAAAAARAVVAAARARPFTPREARHGELGAVHA